MRNRPLRGPADPATFSQTHEKQFLVAGREKKEQKNYALCT